MGRRAFSRSARSHSATRTLGHLVERSVDPVEVCHRCRLGWVEQPYRLPQFQRCGLASAGLAALRAEHPGLAWQALGGHLTDSRSFWAAVGAGVASGYQQRDVCAHICP